MANPHKGETHLEVGNVIYTLVFDVNTIVSIEERLGKGFPSIVAQMVDPERMSFTALRMMLWCALRKNHTDVTLEQAGDMILAVGGFGETVNTISKALQAAFPPPKEDAANPPVPSQTALTGSAS